MSNNVLTAQPRQKIPRLTIVAFIASLFGWFWAIPAIAGLVLGIRGIRQAGTGARGWGLSLAAICISAAWIAIFAILFTVALLLPDEDRVSAGANPSAASRNSASQQPSGSLPSTPRPSATKPSAASEPGSLTSSEKQFMKAIELFAEAFMELTAATGGVGPEATMAETDPVLAQSAFRKFKRVAREAAKVDTLGDAGRDEALQLFIDLVEEAGKDGLRAYQPGGQGELDFSLAMIDVALAVKALPKWDQG